MVYKIIRIINKIVLIVKIKIIIYFINYFHLHYNNVKIGKNTCINGKLFIINKGELKIGNNVVINSRYANNPIGGSTFSSFWVKKGGQIIIGDGCGISNSAFVSAVKIEIGKNVYIGGDCKFYDTDFHSLDVKNRLSKPDLKIQSKPIIIGDNVFIGGGSIILKGVKIGHDSVIGAGSVVTKEIPPKEIWAGNPVRFIKSIQ